MKIGIVALTWQPGKSGGIEIYFRNLLEALQKIDRTNTYRVYVPKGIELSLELASTNFQLISVNTAPKRFLDRFYHKLGIADAPSRRLRKFLENERLDVIHFPLQIMFPMGMRGKTIVSCMDIQQEYFPEFFTREDLNARHLTYRPSLENATFVISISDFTKRTLEEKYDINPRKVRTVYLAHNTSLFKPSKSSDNTKHSYFYYPAATWPHKNHTALLQAFAIFASKYPNVRLYLSGIAKSKSQDIDSLAQELGIQDKIKKLGYLETEKMPLIYRDAEAMIFPSLFEGFGIPLLEAMACGCPVIASNTTSIPEVAGDAALYFNPRDPKDIASKMDSIFADKELRISLKAKGFKRVKVFSPEIMARQTLQVYREAFDA